MAIKWNKEAIKKYIEDNSYTFIKLIKFDKRNSKILIQCNNKNHKPYEVKFDTFLRGSRCRQCENESRKTSYEDVEKFIKDNDYTLFSSKEEYYSNKKILIQCHKSHEPYYVRFSAFKNDNKRCKQCDIENKKNNYDDIYNYIKSQGHLLLEDIYINNTEKMKVKCPNGHIYKMNWGHFQEGTRCPHCNTSSGEQEVARILNKYNILFITEYTFDDCKNIKALPFDFYLKNNIIIEFDGYYHYHSRENNVLDLMNRKYRDDIKTNYCKKNNIQLIRIPYWEYKNIEEILIKELNLK